MKLNSLISSLRVRLLVVFMLIVLVAIGAIALFALQIATSAFRSSVSQNVRADQALTSSLMKAYQSGDSTQMQQLVEQIADKSKIHLLVIDAQGKVVADSSQQLTGHVLTTADLFTLYSVQGGPPGKPATPNSGALPPPLRILSTNAPTTMLGRTSLGFGPPPEMRFTNTITDALWPAVAIAGLAALVFTFLLSSTVLKPIEVLTQVARRMEQGDLSQRVTIHSHDEIGKLGHAFNTMAESLERAEQLRRNMVNDVAHELRTPLTNIRGYLEALLDEVVAPTPTILASLYEEALLLGRLVADLQDLSLAEAGQLKLVRLPVALEDIITKATNALRLQAEAKQLTLTVALPPELPLLEADPERIGQILRNLLHNAIVHTPAGGHIYVNARTVENAVEIQVSDTGVGIAEEHLPHLFKRFYRADRSRTRATGGTGLGLAIVEQLVRAHGGQVSVTSQVGKGTCFTFTLPYMPDVPTNNAQSNLVSSEAEVGTD
jgi:signal transduction histidine kinase